MTIEWQPPDTVPADEDDPRIQAALEELRGLILERFPDATFTVTLGDDPEGVYLKPTVDIEDLDEVTEPLVSRLVEMQVEEGLPVYVVPEWPLERLRAYLQERKSARPDSPILELIS
jgi:hypothetical protein